MPRRRWAALILPLVAAFGCGGDDAAPTSEPVSRGAASALSDDCAELFVDFLKEIEPYVAEIDWDQTTVGSIGVVTDELEQSGIELAERSDALGCDDYDPSADAEVYAALLELARAEAPGSVGWLEYVNSLGPEPLGDEMTFDGDCSDALAVVERYVDEYDGMQDVPVRQLRELGDALAGAAELCSPDEASELFQRDDVTAFLSG